MAGWDWFETLAGFAQVDTLDLRAAAAGLPPVESYDMWPLISGRETQSRRAELVMATVTCPAYLHGVCEDNDPKYSAMVGGVIAPPYKLVLGESPHSTTLKATNWSVGPRLQDVQICLEPDTLGSNLWQAQPVVETCGDASDIGCLFNIYEDPGETTNLAAVMPDVFNRLNSIAISAAKTVYSPYRGPKHKLDSHFRVGNAVNLRASFVGPFIP